MGSGDDSDFGCVAAGLELGVAGVQRCGQCLGHSDVGRVVGGELMAVPPDSLSERLKAMAGDGEREIVMPCLLGDRRSQLVAELEATQDG